MKQRVKKKLKYVYVICHEKHISAINCRLKIYKTKKLHLVDRQIDIIEMHNIFVSIICRYLLEVKLRSVYLSYVREFTLCTPLSTYSAMCD